MTSWECDTCTINTNTEPTGRYPYDGTVHTARTVYAAPSPLVAIPTSWPVGTLATYRWNFVSWIFPLGTRHFLLQLNTILVHTWLPSQTCVYREQGPIISGLKVSIGFPYCQSFAGKSPWIYSNLEVTRFVSFGSIYQTRLLILLSDGHNYQHHNMVDWYHHTV